MKYAGEKQALVDALTRLDESWTRLSRQIAQDLKAEYAAVPPGHLLLLQLLNAYGPQRMSDLAAMLGMSTSGTTLLVDRAIAGQLVKRERDPADRRVVWVDTDDAGLELLERVRQQRAQLLTGYLPDLDADDVEHLIALLTQLTQAALNPSSHQT